MDKLPTPLAILLEECPACAGVYRLYEGARLLHIGMAAGTATLRSELLRHALGEYGCATQRADRVDWEVVPDDPFAYEVFVALYNEAIYAAGERGEAELAPSTSRRHGLSSAAEHYAGAPLRRLT